MKKKLTPETVEEIKSYKMQDLLMAALRLSGCPEKLAKDLEVDKRTVLKWICTGRGAGVRREKISDFIILKLVQTTSTFEPI